MCYFHASRTTLHYAPSSVTAECPSGGTKPIFDRKKKKKKKKKFRKFYGYFGFYAREINLHFFFLCQLTELFYRTMNKVKLDKRYLDPNLFFFMTDGTCCGAERANDVIINFCFEMLFQILWQVHKELHHILSGPITKTSTIHIQSL